MKEEIPYLVLFVGVSTHFVLGLAGMETSTFSFLIGGITAGTMVAFMAKHKIGKEREYWSRLLDTVEQHTSRIEEKVSRFEGGEKVQ